MKTQLLDIQGKKIKEIELPKIFSEKIREDIMKKAYESEITRQPYGPNKNAGKRSAAGKIRHRRHRWGSHYGRGISRVSRKTLWRRGSTFYWIGAVAPGTRGGRKAHPPKIESMPKNKKINKKEYELAIKSAIASTASDKKLMERYEKLKNRKIETLPIIVESKICSLKAGDLKKSVKNILGELAVIGEKKKKIRAGKGTRRNRKYKISAGALVITGNGERLKTKAVENKKVNEVEIKDLYPAGRVVIYTENAVKNLEERK